MKRTLALIATIAASIIGLAGPAAASTTGPERLVATGHRAGGYDVVHHRAPGKIEFTRIVYNPLGLDTTAKLNQEYVRVSNHSNITYRLTGWTITDKQGHTFTFPAGYKLAPGKVAIVHTGHGVTDLPVRGHLYQNSDTFIWNNGGDKATLRSASHRVYDVCAYRPNGGGLTYCI